MVRALLLSMALCCQAQALKKVLVLHGGGDNADGMQYLTADLLSALGNDYEFFYGHIGTAATHESWWADPVSKGTPTTDRNHAQAMVDKLNTMVATDGPFDGIMGYSQGAAAVPVYLSQIKNGSFKWAVMFCGYLPTTHSGLIARINEASPFGDIRALIWMSHEDPIISNPMSSELAKKFKRPSIIVDDHGGAHLPPSRSKATFNTVVTWIKDPSRTFHVGTPLTSRISYFGKGGKGKGGKGKGGKGTGSGCSNLSESSCNANSGCTFYQGYGCFESKGSKGTGGKGTGGKDTGGKGTGSGCSNLSESACNAQYGCTFYQGYGCYQSYGNKGGQGKGGKGTGGKGKGGKGTGSGCSNLSESSCNAQYGCTFYQGYGCYQGYGSKGGKGTGGKGTGGGCSYYFSEAACIAHNGCTFYQGWGCYGSKGGTVVVKGRHLRK